MTYRADIPLVPPEVHRRRLISAGRVGLAFVAISLAIGITGYMALEGLAFLDAFLNASLILSGMGPLYTPVTPAGKVFLGLYSIFSGFAVLGVAAIVFAPIVHRVFHRLRIADGNRDRKN